MIVLPEIIIHFNLLRHLQRASSNPMLEFATTPLGRWAKQIDPDTRRLSNTNGPFSGRERVDTSGIGRYRSSTESRLGAILVRVEVAPKARHRQAKRLIRRSTG